MTRLTLLLQPRAGLVGAIIVIVALGMATWRFHTQFHSAAFPWLEWSDQRAYFLDAQAWSSGDLTAGLHHYLPGYGLCGALFMRVMPWQPFLVPDFISFVVCLAAFCFTAPYLVPRDAFWRLAAPAVFGASTLGTHTLRNLWLMPWSTTGSAPFEFAALLAALHAARIQTVFSMAILGIALGACAGFRPADAAILLFCCAAYVFSQNGRAALPLWRRLVGLGIGAVVGLLPFLLAHIASHGLSMGAYLGRMSEIGFEWRLLPLRWVQIGIDARPVVSDGPGILGAYLWVAAGFAGLLFGAVFSGPARSAWRLVAATIVLHWMLYLCYRDLYPEGLWRYLNVHYFKWSFPFLALAALRLGWAVIRAAERRQAVSCVGVLLLFLLWRPSLAVQAAPASTGAANSTIEADLSHLDGASIIPVSGDWRSIFFSKSELTGNGGLFRTQTDFKLLPYGDGALLIPLRRLSTPPLRLSLDPTLAWRPGETQRTASQRIHFGVPCFLLRIRAYCKSAGP